jgi:peptidoglycan/LPS O-acetylase OafA/YrhL
VAYDPRLTSVRGLAASWVVALHASAIGVPIVVAQLAGVGWLGVAVFFALSGYLILNRLDANPSLPHYAWRRIRRIWPMYFITVLLAYVTFWPPPTYLASHLMFFNAIAWQGGTADLVFWTIALEEWAYALFPLVHRVPRQWVGALGVGLIGSSAAYAILSGALLVDSDATYFCPLLWLGAYGSGLLAYSGWVPGIPRPWVWVFSVSVVTGLVLPRADTLLMVLPILPALMVSPPGFLDWRPLVLVGEVSFALYLVRLYLFDTVGIPLGLLLMLPTAVGFEFAFRGREIVRRMSDKRTAHLGVTA